jgi:hypothetical protein
MKGPRLTIAGTMGVVAVAAGGLAALKNPTRLAASLVFSFAIVAIVAAGVAACCLRGRARAFWGAFVAFGGVYLVLSLGPMFEERTGPHLATTAALDLITGEYDPRPRRVQIGEPPHAYFDSTSARHHWLNRDDGAALRTHHPEFITLAPYSLYRICHSLIALVAGTAGGLFALSLTRKHHTEPPNLP